MEYLKNHWPLENCNFKASTDFCVTKGVEYEKEQSTVVGHFSISGSRREETRMLCVTSIILLPTWEVG